MKKNDEIYIGHMLDAIEKIERYLRTASIEDFIAEDLLFDAVCREFGIIGEAANNISMAFRESHTDIAWKQAIGLRHTLIHEYFGVNAKILWDTYEKDLPILKKSLLPFRLNEDI